jgi:calcium-dependent protein kinase
MKGLLESLEYLHKNCIIHRDIKPENIMFKNKDDLSSLILCDFGLAYKMQDEKFISSKCGTILYMAPEMIKNRKYDYLVDSFSAGIVLYILTSGGKHPIFENSMTTEDYIKKLKSKENFNFTVEMPLLARNLFLKLCKFDPLFRYEIYKALQHPWITRNENGQIPLVIIDEYKKVDKIKNFKSLLSVSFFLNFYKNKYLVKKPELINNENTLFLNNNNNNSISIKEILVNSKSKILNIKNKKTLKFIDFNDSFEKNEENYNIVNKNKNNLNLLKTFNNKSNKNINNNDFILSLKKNNKLNDSKSKNKGKSFYLKSKSKSKKKNKK